MSTILIMGGPVSVLDQPLGTRKAGRRLPQFRYGDSSSSPTFGSHDHTDRYFDFCNICGLAEVERDLKWDAQINDS